MNFHLAILLATLLAQSPAPKAPEGVQLEQCFHFEIEGTATLNGKVETHRETVFTAAELPWTNVGIVDRSNLEDGFQAMEEVVEFEFAGKKVQGKKLTWSRKPNSFSNVSAAAVHCWVLSEVEIPSFSVQLGHRMEFRLPAGCVKVDVVPHGKNAKGIDKSEQEASVAVNGAYRKSTTYKLGDKELNAHEMVFTIPAGERKGTITHTVSNEMPGGICAISIDGEVSRTIRVNAMPPAAPPDNLDYFPKEGFAFAPPAGYTKSTASKEGEVVRYAKGDDFLAVTVVQLGKGGLLELQGEIMGKNQYDLQYIGYSRLRHLAGHRSFDTRHTETHVSTIVADHAGRGYLLSASTLANLQPDETRDFLKGWRWIIVLDR
jgi:hypothetical protein